LLDDEYCRCGTPKHLVLVLHGIGIFAIVLSALLSNRWHAVIFGGIHPSLLGQALEKDITPLTACLRNMSRQYAAAGELGSDYK
jgi:hypothetical protein